jgi:hypothetical protein
MLLLFMCINGIVAQMRYIDANNPVLETINPSRDGSDTYHFYYAFNWTDNETKFNNGMNPQFGELIIYDADSDKIIKKAYLSESENSKGQVEYQVKKSDFKDSKRIKYNVKWEIDKQINNSQTRTVIITFENDPFLKIDIGEEGLHYVENIEVPQIKIKSNKDGTVLNNLSIHLDKSSDAVVIANVSNGEIRANSSETTTYFFKPTGLNSLSEETTYYLRGRFKSGSFDKEIGPIECKINKREQYFIKPPTTGSFTTYGHSDLKEVLESSGDVKSLKAILYTVNNGTMNIPLTHIGSNKWEITIKGNEFLEFGTYKLEFSGLGTNGRPLKVTSCSYTKKSIPRKSIEVEYKEKKYKVTAEFDYEPVNKVYLVIDGRDVEMEKIKANTYTVEFSFDDKNLRALSEKLKGKTDQKISITTKADNYIFPSSITMSAVVIDTEELKDKSKSEIKDSLVKTGYSAKNADELSKTLHKEFRQIKDGGKKVDDNFWATVVELAPKAIPLVMMAL